MAAGFTGADRETILSHLSAGIEYKPRAHKEHGAGQLIQYQDLLLLDCLYSK